MPELESGTGESQPADDIRSALASAIATHDTPVETHAKTAEKIDDPSVDEATDSAHTGSGVEGDESEQVSERARGPDGKFVKKEGEEAEAEAVAADEKAEAKPEAEKTGIEAPVNWKAEDKENFKKIPGEIQKVVSEMVKRQDADYTRKTQVLAAIKKEYEEVDKVFEPHLDVMRAKGFTKATLISAWASVEQQLAAGTESATDVAAGIVRGYKIPIDRLLAKLGIKMGTEAAPAEGAQVETLPPQFQSLQERQEALERQLADDRRVRAEERRQASAMQTRAAEARIENEIEQFKSAKDDKGNLLRPHFDEVAQHMTSLALAAKAAGQPLPPIPELYETAVWANPSTREKLRTAETQQAEAKRKEEARAKAAAAKKAASSVTGAPSPGQTTSSMGRSDKSLREQLEEAAEESLSPAL